MARELGEDKSRNIISSGGFCYSDVSSSNPTIHQTHMMNQIQGFEGNPSEILINLTADSNSYMWKGPGNNPGPSSSKTVNDSATSDHFYDHHDQFMTKQDFTIRMSDTSGETENLIAAAGAWQENNSQLLVDESSLRCVFPCEGNERPSQGLSLSLSSSYPSSFGLQSFELRRTNNQNAHDDQQADGFFGQFQLKNSKYLAPAQKLLNEFCSLETKQNDASKLKSNKSKQWDDQNASSSSRNQSLSSHDFMELQTRKTKLLSMLEEVDRRYRHYCDQMKAVVSSFEAVAGNGAATAYSALASKAMSRHFRNLRDGIVGQIQAIKKATGEKDPIALGTSKGETPRLKIIDQALRHQRAFTMMESHPWRPQRGLPERSVSILRAWLFEHFLHPYPSDVDKQILARQTGLSRSQVSNWFINARVRLWKPMVEEMYLDETKEKDNKMGSSDGVADHLEDNIGLPNQIQNLPAHDKKHTQDQLFRIHSEFPSSIINNPNKNDANETPKSLHMSHHSLQQQNSGTSFGAMEVDFSSYNANNHHENFINGGGGGVSLTLGLQQDGGSGVSLAFSPTSQSSLFYPRDQIEDSQSVQYSPLDGDQGQNLPYRNLMGAQLLHDLAG